MPNANAAVKTTSEVDKASDCLKTEVLYKGKPGEGAAQMRAIVPLEPVRAAVHGAVAERLERATGRKVKRDNMGSLAGMPPELAARVEGLVQKAAQAQTSSLLAKAAASPHQTLTQRAAGAFKRKKRIAMFVALALGGSLAAMGGWIGLRALLRKKRQAQMLAEVGKGKSPVAAKSDMDRDLADDDTDLKAAAAIAQARQVDINDADEDDEDDDEDEDDGGGAGGGGHGPGSGRSNAQMRGDDAAGFSFKRLARGVFMPHTLFRKRRGPTVDQRMSAAQARSDAAQARSDAANAEQDAKTAEQDAKAAEDAAKAPAAAPNEQPQQGENMEGWSIFKKAATAAVPGGGATIAVAQMAHKQGNPKLSKSAMRLAKARKGDQKSKKEILAVRKLAAKPGNPNAKAELKRLHQANALALKLDKPKSLFAHGIV